MSEQKESSVLFSLKELMGLEEDRIRQEEDEKRRKSEAELTAKADAERRAREEEEARVRAEEEKKRLEESRKREETARLEALRQAELEKARVEAEQKARLEAMAKQQEHERHLATLKHDDHKKKLQRALGIGGAVAVLLIGGIGFTLYQKSAQAERDRVAHEAALQAQMEEGKKLQQQLADSTKKLNDLMAQYAAAQTEADRMKIQAQLDAAKQQQEALQRRTGGGGAVAAPGGGTAPPKAKCNCAPGDPLCSCF